MCLKESNEKIRLTIATERRQQSHIHLKRNLKRQRRQRKKDSTYLNYIVYIVGTADGNCE